MLSALQCLAIEQDFSNLGIETNSQSKLDQATGAFNKKELTTSANLFLESWRILQNEYESNLYMQVNSLPELEQQRQTKSRQNKGRMILSLAALNDLARACSQNDEEYKDEAGNCKLQVYALQHGWVRNTIAKVLDMDDSKSSVLLEGKGVAQVFLLKDPLGRLLEKADSFKEAAAIVSKFCFFQVACISETSKKHDVAYEFISNSMRWVCIRASLEAVCIKDAKFKSSKTAQVQAEIRSCPETEKYEGIEKEPVIRTSEPEQHGNPLENEKGAELIDFLEKCHATDYSGKSCQQTEQKDKSESSNEDESTDQVSVYEDFLQDEDNDLVNLFDGFHVTDLDRKK